MIPERNPYNNWSGNGATTTFDFDFYIEDETQLAVYHTNSEGAQTLLIHGTDYSINELQNENGSYITFPLASSSHEVLGDGETISLCLTLPIAQENPFGKSSYLNLETLEYALDYITRICQIINRQMERAVKVKEGADATPDELLNEIDTQILAAQNYASGAAEAATSAYNSAVAAGDEATIATQKVVELQELYSDASTDITSKHETAVNAIETAQSVAENEITTGRNNIASDLSAALGDMATAKTNYDTNATSKTNALNTQYNTASGNLQSQFNSYSGTLDDELDAYLKDNDRLYKGVDLEVKFATEIAQYGNVYAWLEARKNAGNYEGIHVGDYFHTSLSAGTIAGYSIAAQNFKCRIIGLNTYKDCSDAAIGDMIYVSTDEVINTPIKWNPADNNNGTSTRKQPWLASAMYAVLNGGNNYDTTNGYNKVAHGANAGNGIISLLPSALQAVMKQKRNLLDERYSASGLLTGGTGWSWQDMGKLWLPNEIEVYGCPVRSNLCLTSGYWFPEANLSIQFPWFANNCEHRIKKNSSGGRCSWWLSSVASSHSTYVCTVHGLGNAHSHAAAHASIYAPLCFCI